MTSLSELFENKIFIMDIGVTQSVTLNGETVEVGRYAVFSPNKNQKGHQVIEVSSDCGYLCDKYHLTMDSMCIFDEKEMGQNGCA